MMELRGKRILLYTLGLVTLLIVLCLLKWEKLDVLQLLLRGLLLVFGYLAALWDLREKRVPNRLVGGMLGAWILVMAPQLFFQTEEALNILLSSLIGFFIGGTIFLVVYVVSRRGLGGGDVKLMAVSGLFLGIDGVLPTILYGSVLAALTGGILILIKRIGPKDAIPLVPFLYVGMLLTIFIR